jgi:hypothetical protein
VSNIIVPSNIARYIGSRLPFRSNTFYTIEKASLKSAKIRIAHKAFTFKFDGTGYKRQGQYLHKDGIR